MVEEGAITVPVVADLDRVMLRGSVDSFSLPDRAAATPGVVLWEGVDRAATASDVC